MATEGSVLDLAGMIKSLRLHRDAIDAAHYKSGGGFWRNGA